MGITYRQWPMIVVFLVITGTAVLMSFVYSDAENDRQDIDLTQVQALLDSSTRMAEYRLIPESVMTGLCWINADGAREGLFKDVNAGMAHWREREPLIPDDAGPVVDGTSIAAEKGIDYAQLSNELEQLSFIATGYRYCINAVEIIGILTIADNSHKVVLMVDLPETASQHGQKDRIELTASTKIKPADFGDALSAVTDEQPGLCIAMQAAKQRVLSELSPDQPLMLSHYY
jgi:hypothetical protein